MRFCGFIFGIKKIQKDAGFGAVQSRIVGGVE